MANSRIEDRRIADLTVDEFQALMRETMQEVIDQVQEMIWELEQELPDPDEKRKLRPKVAAQLRQASDQNPAGSSLDEVKRSLGLE